MQREALQPFDLATGPLLRATALRLGAEEHVLLFTMHHIVSDGWSMGLLVREVAALYKAYQEGQESPLEELAVQYADYGVAARVAGRRGVGGAVGVLAAAVGGSAGGAGVAGGSGAAASAELSGNDSRSRLSEELTAGLKELSRRSGVTLFMTLLGAFQVLLSHYSGQREIVVGTPIANRNRKEIEGLIGFFVNTLVLRTDWMGIRFSEK